MKIFNLEINLLNMIYEVLLHLLMKSKILFNLNIYEFYCIISIENYIVIIYNSPIYNIFFNKFFTFYKWEYQFNFTFYLFFLDRI